MDKRYFMKKLFDEGLMTKWEVDDRVVYTFKHERHMYEFMLYRDYDSFGITKLFAKEKFTVMIMKKNIKFGKAS
jgi:hypothetical protein